MLSTRSSIRNFFHPTIDHPTPDHPTPDQPTIDHPTPDHHPAVYFFGVC